MGLGGAATTGAGGLAGADTSLEGALMEGGVLTVGFGAGFASSSSTGFLEASFFDAPSLAAGARSPRPPPTITTTAMIAAATTPRTAAISGPRDDRGEGGWTNVCTAEGVGSSATGRGATYGATGT